jgi:quinoprotein glucose dehydrogenase
VANIQATPIYTGKLLVFPNALDEIVAVDPETGKSVWKFKPGITRPAQRGLVYWAGTPEVKPRILFSAGGRVFALDAATGLPSTEFNGGSVVLGYEIRVAPAISGNIMLTTSFKPALHAYDVKTGVKLWTTDFLLNDEMSDARDASPVYEGANTWGGFSVDDIRQLAFMTTSNATPVGVGIHRRGRNAMANSVLAIDIKTGKHRWNHQ